MQTETIQTVKPQVERLPAPRRYKISLRVNACRTRRTEPAEHARRNPLTSNRYSASVGAMMKATLIAILTVSVLSACTPAHQPMSDTDTRCALGYTDCPIGAEPLEDEPGWDCATMGNRYCSSLYEPDTGAYIGGYN